MDLVSGSSGFEGVEDPVGVETDLVLWVYVIGLLVAD